MKWPSGNQEKNERTTKKKAKGMKEAKEVAAEEVPGERKEAEEGTPAAAEWASFWSGVYEEMPWATSWIPFWEVDAYDVLYGDVLWDYDIWDFKGINGLAPKI